MLKIQSYAEPKQQTGVGCTQKALVISNDEEMRGMLEYALGSYGMQVVFCQSDAEALSFSLIDPGDCIIIDCDTPGMDALDLVRRLRGQFEFVTIIGLCNEDRGASYLQAGANDFLQKPFVPYRLAMMLDGGDILD